MSKFWKWLKRYTTLMLFITVMVSNYNVYRANKYIVYLVKSGALDTEIIELQAKLIKRYKAESNKPNNQQGE